MEAKDTPGGSKGKQPQGTKSMARSAATEMKIEPDSFLSLNAKITKLQNDLKSANNQLSLVRQQKTQVTDELKVVENRFENRIRHLETRVADQTKKAHASDQLNEKTQRDVDEQASIYSALLTKHERCSKDMGDLQEEIRKMDCLLKGMHLDEVEKLSEKAKQHPLKWYRGTLGKWQADLSKWQNRHKVLEKQVADLKQAQICEASSSFHMADILRREIVEDFLDRLFYVVGVDQQAMEERIRKNGNPSADIRTIRDGMINILVNILFETDKDTFDATISDLWSALKSEPVESTWSDLISRPGDALSAHPNLFQMFTPSSTKPVKVKKSPQETVDTTPRALDDENQAFKTSKVAGKHPTITEFDASKILSQEQHLVVETCPEDDRLMPCYTQEDMEEVQDELAETKAQFIKHIDELLTAQKIIVALRKAHCEDFPNSCTHSGEDVNFGGHTCERVDCERLRVKFDELSEEINELTKYEELAAPLVRIARAIRLQFLEEARADLAGEKADEQIVLEGVRAARAGMGEIDNTFFIGVDDLDDSPIYQAFSEIYKTKGGEAWDKLPELLKKTLDCQATIHFAKKLPADSDMHLLIEAHKKLCDRLIKRLMKFMDMEPGLCESNINHWLLIHRLEWLTDEILIFDGENSVKKYQEFMNKDGMNPKVTVKQGSGAEQKNNLEDLIALDKASYGTRSSGLKNHQGFMEGLAAKQPDLGTE